MRRASINNFGAGGANTHAIVDDPEYYVHCRSKARARDKQLAVNSDHSASESDQADGSEGAKSVGQTHGKSIASSSWTTETFVFTLSTNDEVSLRSLTKAYASYIDDQPSWGSYRRELIYTLTNRRSKLPWRLAIPTRDTNETSVALRKAQIQRIDARPPRLGFIFTGQGAQWFAIGRGLIEAYPEYARAIEDAETRV
jgi:acyl transferase domain-containing protein